jgi:23S rRNA G2445 N2-methylase RlmL
MKQYIAICAKGLEDINQLEIKEILGAESEVVIPGRVKFSTGKIDLFISKTQSAMKVYELKQEPKEVEAIIPFEVEEPFRVSCSRKGDHMFTSNSVEKEVGETFFNQGNKVDLTKPKTIVFIDIVNDTIFVGIDLTPKLLSKREYRLRTHNQSINACIAYSLIRLAGYEQGKLLLDPFPKDGVVVIEALLFSKGKVYAIDPEFSTIKKIEINSKLAGVRKEVNLSRSELEWVDTKLQKGEVDCVVSSPPFPSRHMPEKEVDKLYKEFWHQMSFILNKESKIVLIAPTLQKLRESCQGFKVVEERVVGTSAIAYEVVIFKKN